MVRFVPLRAFAVLVSVALATRASAVDWRPVAPSELADSKPLLAESAAAEVLDWRVSLDDSEYPQFRILKQYIRYKIYDASKATNITRISEFNSSYNGNDTVDESKMRARLTLPDGTTKEFGKEAIQNRTVEHQGDEGFFGRFFGTSSEVNEKFLAVPGIVNGAVLEFQTETTLNGGIHFLGAGLFTRVLQKHEIGVRHVEYTQEFPGREYTPIPFVRNSDAHHAEAKFDKGSGRLLVKADNLPPLYNEPYSPPELDRALAIDGTYFANEDRILAHHPDVFAGGVYTNTGAWGAIATRTAMIENDVVRDSSNYAKASELCKGAASDMEKAQRIHRYVHQLYIRWRNAPKKPSKLMQYYAVLPYEVIDFEKYPDSTVQPNDFEILALGLYRAAGLKADTLMLPNNAYSTFSQTRISAELLPDRCVRVFVDGQWLFSAPHLIKAMPLGAIPPYNRGTVGLVAQVNKNEFIPIPFSSAQDSVIRNEGDLTLTADGRLTGTLKQTVTGALAFQLRPNANGSADPARFGRQWGRRLRTQLKADEVTVTDVSGVADPDAPLVIRYTATWNSYASVFKSHVVFVQSVFGSRANPLFTAETRHNDLEFPFHYQQIDDVAIHLPDGYALEAPSAPVSQPGTMISALFHVGYKKASNTLMFSRTFTSNLTYVPSDRYADLKHWLDVLAKSENHELVLVKAPVAAPAPPVTPGAAAPAAARAETPAPAPAPADTSS